MCARACLHVRVQLRRCVHALRMFNLDWLCMSPRAFLHTATCPLPLFPLRVGTIPTLLVYHAVAARGG